MFIVHGQMAKKVIVKSNRKSLAQTFVRRVLIEFLHSHEEPSPKKEWPENSIFSLFYLA